MAKSLSSFSNQIAFDPSNLSAFGDFISNSDTPIIQLDFIGDTINTYLCTPTVANSATIDQNNSRVRTQSGTNSAGSAIFRSNKIAKYRPGQGMKARWTRAFASPQANSTQISGVGNSIDGYFFGYNGTTFGILHRNNSVDTWYSLNGDPLPLGFDATKGNIYQIIYPYLGFGPIYFFVLSPKGKWILIHVIEYPNTSILVQITDPNLYFYDHVLNTGNTTNLIGYLGSVSVFLSGQRKFLGTPFAQSNLKTNLTTTQTNILTLKNATTFNGVPNRKQLRPDNLSIAWDGGNGTCLINLIRNTTLGGSPSYTTINGTTADAGVTITNGQSCISYDTAGTTISGGHIIWNDSLARNSTFTLDLSEFNLFLPPSETWTISATCQVSGDVRVALNWIEE